jgi:glutathione S-transferase
MSKDLPESLELYLFAICPFAQRVNISLIQSQLSYEIKQLDPMNMPDDFAAISPLGNVPVLRVNGSESIFESAIINDYIAQISPVKMEPESELERAKMRAWNEYGTTCLSALMEVVQAEDEKAAAQANESLMSKLNVLSAIISGDGPYFYGENFMTIDSTYAPLFLRMQTLKQLTGHFSLAGMDPQLARWMDALLNVESVQKSILGDFKQMYRNFIGKRAQGKFIDTVIN